TNFDNSVLPALGVGPVLPRSSTTATATSSVAGSPYPITCLAGTLSASNYDFAFVAGTLTVETATLTVTADHQSRDYGVANPTLTSEERRGGNDGTLHTGARNG